MKLSEFIHQYVGWIGAIAAGAIGLSALWISYKQAARRRQRILLSRPVCQPQEWFESFYPIPLSDRPLIESMLAKLAGTVGAHWTQLRPTDSVTNVLRLHEFAASAGDDFEEFDEHLSVWARARGVSSVQLWASGDRLIDLLDSIRRTASLDETQRDQSADRKGDESAL